MAFADIPFFEIRRRLAPLISAGLLCFAAVACTAPAPPAVTPDPYEQRNRSVHGFNKALDQKIVRPTAFG